jgi:hypothetical protein
MANDMISLGMRMRSALILSIIVLLIAGCGYDPDKKAYDTSKNPDGFPPAALSLVDGIESGKLDTYDTITATFADLYTNHPELLDNPQWRTVIGRLGAKFKFKAEQLALAGPSRFVLAAHYYTLAAFARPEDDRLQERKELFDTWTQAVADSVVAADFDPSSKNVTLSDQLAVLKYFMLSDSLHQQFGREYLQPNLLDVRTASAVLKGDIPGNLAASDICFLLTLGYKGKIPASALASFTEPNIDLISMRISRQTGKWYAAEFYFVPREKLTSDLHVAFRLMAPDSSAGEPRRQIPYDFRPALAATGWKSGTIAASYRRFQYDGPPTEALVGLYEKSADSTHFVPLRDTGAPLYRGPMSVFAQH